MEAEHGAERIRDHRDAADAGNLDDAAEVLPAKLIESWRSTRRYWRPRNRSPMPMASARPRPVSGESRLHGRLRD